MNNTDQNLLDTIALFWHLKATSSKLDKQAILDANKENVLFKEMIKWYLNTYITTGIAESKMEKAYSRRELSDNGSLVTDGLTNMIEAMDYVKENNTGTDLVTDYLMAWFDNFDIETQGFLAEWFSKTFKFGVSAKSANKVFGKDFIPIFDVQLAHGLEKHLDKIDDNTVLTVTQKLDGIRALAIVAVDAEEEPVEVVADNISILSRQGIEFDGLAELKEDIAAAINATHLLGMSDKYRNGVVLDGELLLKNDDNLSTSELFQKTSRALRLDGPKTGILYNVFDLVSYEQFMTLERSTDTYEQRRKVLSSFEENKADLVNVLPVLDTITGPEAISKWSDWATENDYEGVMLNFNNGKHSYYSKKRTPGLLKVKKFHDADLEVIGFEEGTGKNAGTLGAVVVQLPAGNTVNVGSGFTDEERREVWANKADYLNKILTVKYFQTSVDSKTGLTSLRFPTFVTFRDDKDEADTELS